MAAYRKAFSTELYSKYDSAAKEKLISYLQKQGHELLKNKETFDADLVTLKDGKRHYSEAEIKTAWSGQWPSNWAEIRIPERKKKLLGKHGELKFYIISRDMTQCWCIDSSLLTDDLLREASGRNIFAGEQFYHVPYQQAEHINLTSH